ncbi:MAG: hypothetical protein CMP23_14620 [Rickettsiales bacterium]|nr:hypothetical protein [Rickettsiales bacterium]
MSATRLPTLLLLLCALTGFMLQSAGCDRQDGDDDDATRDIPPPEGCSYNSLANVTFAMTIHWQGTDYGPDVLTSLVKSWDPPALYFPFTGQVTEFADDQATGLQAITLTEQPAEGEEPAEDPNWVRIVYSLPLGYSLPLELDQIVGVHTIIDYSTGVLITGFSFWEIMEDGSGQLLFMAEPSDLGLAYLPGELHPAFNQVTLRDRACPNIAALQCANPYNLSIEFETVVPGDDDDSATADDQAPAEPDYFELWPTEHHDFSVGELELRVVNVWSYGYREIDASCTGYDWSADRMSFFVIRSEFAP